NLVDRVSNDLNNPLQIQEHQPMTETEVTEYLQHHAVALPEAVSEALPPRNDFTEASRDHEANTVADTVDEMSYLAEDDLPDELHDDSDQSIYEARDDSTEEIR